MMMNCKRATDLTEKKLEVGLEFSEKVSLKFHQVMCKACKKYEEQMEHLNTKLKQHFEHGGEVITNEELKHKIISKL